ncbi:MAG TPA: MerR family DNA-binding protein [Coleofasciculaceae cyanobacterium]|jgi:DNA-binding transcriptional MerR regulator
MSQKGFLIGELSHKMRISTQTIRYYERLGLLNEPERNTAHYRIYSEEAEQRLQFIQKAKHFGLSLEEIKSLIEIRAKGVAPCANLKAMVEKHLNDLEQRIQEMLAFRQELSERYEQIETIIPDSSAVATEICQGKICGIIERDNKNKTKNSTDY